MTDYISRNGAKVALAKMRSDYDFDYNAIVDKCINRIMQLPIYRQEQKVGKWITEIDCGNHRHFYCPFCRNEGWGTQNYCCECGAKMEGDQL